MSHFVRNGSQSKWIKIKTRNTIFRIRRHRILWHSKIKSNLTNVLFPSIMLKIKSILARSHITIMQLMLAIAKEKLFFFFFFIFVFRIWCRRTSNYVKIRNTIHLVGLLTRKVKTTSLLATYCNVEIIDDEKKKNNNKIIICMPHVCIEVIFTVDLTSFSSNTCRFLIRFQNICIHNCKHTWIHAVKSTLNACTL